MALDTLGALKTYARQISDMENSNFVGDAEWTTYVVLGLSALYDLLVGKFEDYYAAVWPFTTTDANKYDLPDGSGSFPLPAPATGNYPAFYKVLGCDLIMASNVRVSLRPFMVADRNRYTFPTMVTAFGPQDLRYHILGKQLWFTPSPTSGKSIEVLYIPKLVEPTVDADAIDVQMLQGWQEYAAIYAAIKAREKQESDVSTLGAQLAQLEQRIETAAANRDAGAPQTVGDTFWRGYWGRAGGWDGSGGWPGMGV